MSTKSTPKFTKINADDTSKTIYRNMGNNHYYPLFWGTSVTLPANASSVVLASGIKFHGYELASYASVVATPKGNVGSFYTTANTTANTITFNCSSAPGSDTDIALLFILGYDAALY